MLTKEEMAKVKQEYINTLKQLKRTDCDVDGFIAYLEATDFFEAPASTQYHCSFPGGLCLHSLNVYDVLKHLNALVDNKYSNDSLILTALTHDLDKIQKYEKTVKNEKIYAEDGDKKDELGTFKWKSTMTYKMKEASERLTIGSKGFSSYSIASYFFTFTQEEMNAIVYQYSAVGNEQIPDLSTILSKNNLCVLLHCADILTTYCLEK